MDAPTVSVCAVVFDVYGTLLEAGPADDTATAEAAWARLWHETFSTLPKRSRADFLATCERLIAACHTERRRAGIPHPEVLWPEIVAAALRESGAPPVPAWDRFLTGLRRLDGSVRLAPGAAEVLRILVRSGVRLGIASNAQGYTRRELAEALADHGLGFDIFAAEACFWSFEHGFSKPDPHVFQILTTRFGLHGVAPGNILMVGDRADNDVQPARAFGWQAWHLRPESGHDWPALGAWLSHIISKPETNP